MSCTIKKTYPSRAEAKACKPVLEKLVGKPHKITASGYCSPDWGCDTWYYVTEDKDCYLGAVFDHWVQPNYRRAQECADALNNLGNTNIYGSALHEENFLIRDYYKVVKRSKAFHYYKIFGTLNLLPPFLGGIAGRLLQTATHVMINSKK